MSGEQEEGRRARLTPWLPPYRDCSSKRCHVQHTRLHPAPAAMSTLLQLNKRPLRLEHAPPLPR